jgi:hypothetical protein
MGLHEVMGCREEHVQTGQGGRTELRWATDSIPGIKAGEMIPARWYEETLAPVGPASNVAARFADGRAAAVISAYGRGKTLMLGSYLSAAYYTRPGESARRFFSGLLNWAGVQPPVAVEGGPVEIQTLVSGKDRLVFAFNHGTTAVSPRIRLPAATGSFNGRDLITDSPVPVTAEAAGNILTGSIQPGQVWVVHLSAKP